MTDPRRPLPPSSPPSTALPLQDVFAIVERRRRQRARVKAVAAPAFAVGAAGLAGMVVLVVQTGGGTPGTPAASPPAVFTTTTAPTTTAPRVIAPTTPRTAPPFSSSYLDRDYLTQLATSIFDRPDDQLGHLQDEATAMADAWGVDFYPAAKAIAAKADLTGTDLHTDDPHGDDKLVSRFRQAGYTDEYGATLAQAWGTDTHTAEILGALVIEAGCCG